MYKNKSDKAFFQHDMTYQGFKNLSRTFAGKILRDKTFNISKNLKYDGYQKDLVSTVYKFVGKKFFFGSGIENEDIPNKELDKILHQPIVRTFNKKKVH